MCFCICENEDADHGNFAADQHLFTYTDSTLQVLPKSEISYVVVQPDLCRSWLENSKAGFLTMRLICEPNLGG